MLQPHTSLIKVQVLPTPSIMTTALMNKNIQHYLSKVQYPVRDSPYPQACGYGPRYFGHTDLEVRQGCYIKAESEQDAIAQMAELYPDDEAEFTAHPWRGNLVEV